MSCRFKKRGRKQGYRKPDALAGKLSMRVPADLLEWLEDKAAAEGIKISDKARTILVEAMHQPEN
jgi:DNA polymerase III delta subunit